MKYEFLLPQIRLVEGDYAIIESAMKRMRFSKTFW